MTENNKDIVSFQYKAANKPIARQQMLAYILLVVYIHTYIELDRHCGRLTALST